MELPGELTAQHSAALYGLIEQALHVDDAVRKPADAALRQCEQIVGFVDVLCDIVARGDTFDWQGRLMAVICLKNAVQRTWRPRGRADVRTVSVDERARLKAFMLSEAVMHEGNRQVAVQLAVLCSKVARNDWPSEWTELFPTLISHAKCAQDAGSECQQRWIKVGAGSATCNEQWPAAQACKGGGIVPWLAMSSDGCDISYV